MKRILTTLAMALALTALVSSLALAGDDCGKKAGATATQASAGDKAACAAKGLVLVDDDGLLAQHPLAVVLEIRLQTQQVV